MKQAIFTLLIFCNAWLLVGCIQVIPEPVSPPQLIKLSPQVSIDNTLPKRKWQLSVEEPSANQMLDSTRIVIKTTSESTLPHWEYVKGRGWIERLPRMIQEDIIEHLIESEKIAGVGRADQSFSPDYVLLITVYDFQIEQNPTPPSQIHLRLLAQLQSTKTQKLVASKIFQENMAVEHARLTDFREAANLSYSSLLTELVEWIIKQEE